MGERLVTWRKSSAASKRDGFTREQEEFLILAREGYRLMAHRRLRGPQNTGSPLQEVDAADEIAQQLACKMVSDAARPNIFPFNIKKIDELLTSSITRGIKETGDGSPLNGYIYRAMSNGVGRAIVHIEKKHKELNLAKEGLKTRRDNGQLTTAYRVINANNNNVVRQVSQKQNLEMLSRIQDQYLERVTYKGKTLISLIGDWRPLDEWTGRRGCKERPKDEIVGEETLRIHMNKILFTFWLEKSRTKKMKDSTEKQGTY